MAFLLKKCFLDYLRRWCRHALRRCVRKARCFTWNIEKRKKCVLICLPMAKIALGSEKRSPNSGLWRWDREEWRSGSRMHTNDSKQQVLMLNLLFMVAFSWKTVLFHVKHLLKGLGNAVWGWFLPRKRLKQPLKPERLLKIVKKLGFYCFKTAKRSSSFLN